LRGKQITDAFASEAKKLQVGLALRVDFADGLDVSGPQFSTMRDVLAGLELGRVILDAEPFTEIKGKP
jgi:hypothetical protein